MGLKLDYNIYYFFLNNFFFIKWNKFYLISSIIQEIITKNVIMLAWLNNISLLKTFLFFYLFYFSRSVLNIWFKGFFSLNFQYLKYIYLDCDMDCFLFKILQSNNKSCHTNNNFFCFFNKFINLWIF